MSLDRRRALMVAKKARLPAEYQEVEWIGVKNTNSSNCAYLSLPATLFRFNSSVTIKIKIGTTSTAELGYFGGSDGENSFELYYSAQALQSWGTIHIISAYSGDVYDTCTAKKTTRDTITLLLMTYRKDRYLFTGRCYGASFADADGNTISNLVPCYRKADGAVGMFDLIGKAFYSNAGTGSFTKGADVV